MEKDVIEAIAAVFGRKGDGNRNSIPMKTLFLVIFLELSDHYPFTIYHNLVQQEG